MAGFAYRDKVALITGGSRGLGLEIARQICARGGKVALIARTAEQLTVAKTDLDRFGTEILTLQSDLLETAQIQSAVQQTLQRFRKIDILINNAGIIEIGPIEHMQLKDFDRAMRLHFWAPFILYLLVAPHMRANGGRIVNISSIGGRIAVPHIAAYSASKFALTGFSDAIRAELARDNIFVTTVTPGLMRTGSQIHATFKGDHAAEYKWFDWSRQMPLISMNADRAARKILAACRRGQPSLTLTFAARKIILGNALFPNLTGYLMKFVNRLLPGTGGEQGNKSRGGSELLRL